MRVILYTLIILAGYSSWAQDGQIIEKKIYTIPDSVNRQVQKVYPELNLNKVNFFRITYLSDGLKVVGYIAEPKENGKYPCIIANRGGQRTIGAWTPTRIASILGQMASWGYVVIASQYRGNDGGEGKEEFGGKDLNDVFNLIPILSQLQNADTTRLGIFGRSRGGIMTYLSLTKTCRFKAAVVHSGITNLFTDIKNRPEVETNALAELIPNYWTDKDKELRARSAVFWADKMCITTPLLIVHGSADKAVHLSEPLELINKLYEFKHPTRFIVFEGSDHSISEFRADMFDVTKRHFDYYLRDGKKYPSMELH
jgi:dipeptidyl aminopeptidase/acylaminoacyl peptidase